MSKRSVGQWATLAMGTIALLAADIVGAEPAVDAEALLRDTGVKRGICAVLGLPDAQKAGFVIGLVDGSELSVYFQSPDAGELESVRDAADARGLLGKRVFVDKGDFATVHLASNLADVVVASRAAGRRVSDDELRRVLRPGATAVLGDRKVTAQRPEGVDEWTHVFHGPDNNPQSTDTHARAPYLTQFLAEPMFSPMPEVTVAAGGRLFKAFGHIAHKANQNEVLNTLICVNAYNGTILWRRKLREGFMIHRNTMIATADALYLGDDESCKVIDAATGEVRDEIRVPDGVSDGPVWKWMAIVDGVLYALVGNREVVVDTQRSNTPGLGHWPWGMWKGHDYRNPATSFGFGRTFLAIELSSEKTRWTHREEEYVDSRGVCMFGDRIYFYSPEKHLAALDAGVGDVRWRNTSRELLDAIGPNHRAQHYVTGYSTTTYIKGSKDHVFFAGPQRKQLVAASTTDGALRWTKSPGNLQIVLRDAGIWAAGPQNGSGMVLGYESGDVLHRLPARRACTRATGSIDSVFFRATGGTVRIDVASNTAKHIAPMRPPCQDGVIISEGHLYWGPWMCGCQLSLYGHIGLSSVGDFDLQPDDDGSRHEVGKGQLAEVANLAVRSGDWPAYRHDRYRSSATNVQAPAGVTRAWSIRGTSLPAAPVLAGGLTFIADRSGVLRALDVDGKERWKSYTGGAIYQAPTVAAGRIFAGSADGRVYAFEAATGRFLWSYRVAPAKRWMPVYGKLISTWPVAGGVAVQDGVVYAAAGVAHYDGTHVVALDAVTGKPRWHDDSSGMLSKDADSGISLQGELRIAGSELQFAGGGRYHTARFDLRTGKCLNQPRGGVSSQFHTAFYAYYPEYGKYVSLRRDLEGGRTLTYEAAYEGSRFSDLALLGPGGDAKPGDAASRRDARRGRVPGRKTLWRQTDRRITSFVVTPKVLLAAGHTAPDGTGSFLSAIAIDTGRDLWREALPATAVKSGVAIDHDGRIIVCLEDGQVICFVPARSRL